MASELYKMTNEQAIKIIQNEYRCVDCDCDIERSCGKCELHMPSKELILKAYKMAIQALSQEPAVYPPCEDCHKKMDEIRRAYDRLSEQESCDDAISREDRLIDLANAIESDDSGYWTNKRISSVLRNIEKLPPVTQKSGKWIKVTNGRGGHECDICHEYAPSYQSGDEYLTKYCPNCGAKMVEPQERSE